MTNPEHLNDLMTVVAATISKEMEGGIASLKEDKLERHRIANLAQLAVDKSTSNEHRIEGLETRMTALLGDGTGGNGRLAEFANALRVTQASLSEVQSDTKSIVAKLEKMETVTEKSSGLFTGGKMIAGLIGIVGTIITIIGSCAAAVIWVSTHSAAH